MYLNQYWKDERLSFSPEEDKVLTLSGDFAEKIWVPDTFFANDKNRYVLLLQTESQFWSILLVHIFNYIHANRNARLKEKLQDASFMFQLPPRRDRTEQNGAIAWRRSHYVWNEIHHYLGVYDGPSLLSARLAKLHCRN